MTTRAARQMQDYFTAPVAQRLAAALRLHRGQGRSLADDPVIKSRLARVRELAASLQGQMEDMEMGSRCSRCAARPGGGCCSAVMADNTDAILLLINMLLGTEMEWQEENPADCSFLGRQGCTLAIKPIFCLNYNCSRIRNAAGKEEMATLEYLAGRLLGAQTELEGILLDRLARLETGR